MIHGSIARRYARALLEAVGDSFERPHADLMALVRSIEASPEAIAFFADPTVRKEEKRAFVERWIEGSKIDPMIANLLRLLADRDRLALLPGIARVFDAMVDERKGRVKARVRSAVELTDEETTKLRDALTRATQKEVELEVGVDPEILGGLIAEVGSTVFDGSMRTQLASLRKELMGRA